MTPPRLLHIHGSTKFGGDSVLILELADAARNAGFEVDVLATDPVFQKHILERGLGLIDLDVIRREIRPIWDTRGLVRLTRFLRDAGYTIVHTHSSKPGFVGRRAACRAGVPGIVHTVHGFGFHEESGPVAQRVFVQAERTAARWCHRIVTVSDFHRQRALEVGIGHPDQVVAIPNGVPEDRVAVTSKQGETREALGLSGEFVVLSTGRLAEQKGLEYLIRAAPLLAESVPNICVLLAGDGPLRADLESLVSTLGVQDTVRFLGFRTDIGDLLRAADVVAMPSLWEGLSISLLEAMAAGKPVVTTTIGSNHEVTRNGEVAELVPPKDPDALARAIERLWRDPERRVELGRRARREQAERYSISAMLDRYVEVYHQILSAGGLVELDDHGGTA